jgi:hypothetical protein
MSELQEIRGLLLEARAQHDEIAQRLFKLYPVGAHLRFQHCTMKCPAEAEVLRHGFFIRIEVRNLRTGKTRWIYQDEILDDGCDGQSQASPQQLPAGEGARGDE